MRKVKGHATKEDVKEGRSNEHDREGNNLVDGHAGIGVIKVGGVGLVKLGAWLAERHDAYIAFMRRIQKMIVAITKAEKRREAKTTYDQEGYDRV